MSKLVITILLLVSQTSSLLAQSDTSMHSLITKKIRFKRLWVNEEEFQESNLDCIEDGDSHHIHDGWNLLAIRSNLDTVELTVKSIAQVIDRDFDRLQGYHIFFEAKESSILKGHPTCVFVKNDGFVKLDFNDGAFMEVTCENVVCMLFREFNFFSPNGDDKNDWWTQSFRDIDEFELSIYNRWGEVVLNGNEETFEKHSVNSTQEYVYKLWDGNIQDTKIEAQTGTYYYTLKYELENEQIQKQGTITLLR